MADIIIAKFRGVYRSADPDDLTPDFFYTQKNAKIRPGKLVKDYGFGIKCNNKALSLTANYTIYQMAVQTHPSLTNPTGYRYYIIAVHNSTYVVKIYHYDDDNDIWDELSLSEPYYHKKAWNPVIQTPDAIRFLPGNTGKPDGTHTAKGIWYGYIDRDLFWNTVVTIAAFTNYNTMPAHDGYDILATDTLLTEAVAGLGADTYYYKLVPIYDGVQEPLLPNDFVSGDIDADKVFRIQWTMDSSTFCKRITGFKIYRASATDPIYYHVLTVDTRITDGSLIYKENSLVGYGLYVPNAGWTADALENKGIIIGSKFSGYIMGNSTDCIMVSDVFTSSENYWGDGHYEIWDGYIKYYGNFEDGTVDSWSAVSGSNVANTGSVYHRGTKSLLLYPDEGVKPGDAQRTVSGLTQNTTYYVRVYYYAATSQLVSLKLDGVLKDSKTGAATTWHYLEGTVATGAGDTDITIYIYGALSGNLDNIFIDDNRKSVV